VTTTSAVAGRVPLARLVAAWVELTKPRIVLLVLVTGLPALLLATGRMPAPGLMLATLAGIGLAAASAAAFNHYVDRDIDGLMRRTAARPLPSGLLPPAHALILGYGLGALALAILTAFTTPLAAALALASILYYAVFYTMWLKRRTPENIVIGGGAGASAPLIAWAAVTGSLSLTAWLLAAIVFLWTPPHFWALSLYRREDYLRAGIPMLPVTHGEAETRRRIVAYSWILVAATLAVAWVAGTGLVYTAPAVLLGAAFLRDVHRLHRTAAIPDAVRVFRFSILYLLLLYVALTADALVRVLGRA
jgi:heme o synthase